MPRAGKCNIHCGIFRAMNTKLCLSSFLCGLVLMIPATAPAAAPATPATADEAFYTLGLNLGQQLRQNGVDAVSMSRIERGIQDALAGKTAVGTDQMRLQAFLRASADAAAERNAAAAHAYLAHNAKASGVMTTPSGLQYKILEAGDATATSPQPADLVTLRFRGTLLDGTEFVSSSKPGTAATVQVNGVMRAWTEALTRMKPGAKWQLFVPPELGYGQATRMGVPGGSLLIYEIELQNVMPAPGPAMAGTQTQ
jgi:FKBP-type peptidyl-prolyl cis-trans isomerase FklB